MEGDRLRERERCIYSLSQVFLKVVNTANTREQSSSIFTKDEVAIALNKADISAITVE